MDSLPQVAGRTGVCMVGGATTGAAVGALLTYAPAMAIYFAGTKNPGLQNNRALGTIGTALFIAAPYVTRGLALVGALDAGWNSIRHKHNAEKQVETLIENGEIQSAADVDDIKLSGHMNRGSVYKTVGSAALGAVGGFLGLGTISARNTERQMDDVRRSGVSLTRRSALLDDLTNSHRKTILISAAASGVAGAAAGIASEVGLRNQTRDYMKSYAEQLLSERQNSAGTSGPSR
jgi:NADPH:quinone reductase-like Zn-dependent oxidoreductase